MMKTFLLLALSIGVALLYGLAPQAQAVTLIKDCGTADQCSIAGENKLQAGSGNIVWNVVSTILILLGTISVIMIIVGGIRYTLSGGDQNSVKEAKNTVLFAVIGLVVAILAGTIVLYFTNAFG